MNWTQFDLEFKEILNIITSYCSKWTNLIKNGFKYDLIFTNNQYEKGVTGPNTLDKLKQIKGFKTPVIIHTVDFNKRETYIKEYGFDEYIEKPLNTEKVKPILNKFLNKGKKKWTSMMK